MFANGPGNLGSIPGRVKLKTLKMLIDTIYQPLRSGRIWHKVNFYTEFNRFEFRVFFLLD